MGNPKTKTQTNGHNTWTLTHVRKDIDGNDWYALADYKQLPSKRELGMRIKQSYCEIGIDRVEIMSAKKLTMHYIKEGEPENVQSLFDHILDRFDFKFNKRNILNMSTVFFTINDEKIYEFDEIADEMKTNVLARDQESADFFLHHAWDISKKLIPTYASIAQNSLQELLKMEQIIKSRFGQPIKKSSKRKKESKATTI